MVNRKIIVISLLVLLIIIGIISYFNVTNIPPSEGKLIVKHSSAQGMLIAECADPSYVKSNFFFC